MNEKRQRTLTGEWSIYFHPVTRERKIKVVWEGVNRFYDTEEFIKYLGKEFTTINDIFIYKTILDGITGIKGMKIREETAKAVFKALCSSDMLKKIYPD